MSLVDEYGGAVAAGDVHQFDQRRSIAENAVNAFDHHQFAAAPILERLKPTPETGRIVVGEPERGGQTKPGGIVDAGVAIAVDQNDVVMACESGNRSQLRVVAGGKDQGVRASE